ncbi:MAG: pantoate--beta-alanine ligase [Flavobacteriales bacterium]|nr:pantoate--beta-alanine ligase [Flavobacteriales bacterium]
MQVVKNLQDLNKVLKIVSNKSIGFVPTMGSLHRGHLSLVRASKKKTDYTVVSIFVNPTQFDNQNDYNNYPINLQNDISLLNNEEVDLLFIPDYEELYSSEKLIKIDLHNLDKVLEGKHRKGHFDGVVRVVSIFFNLIKPQYAFLGEKDYQQYLIISLLAKELFEKVKIILCPTFREESGLAMSSRNLRLEAKYSKETKKLFELLTYCKKNFDVENRKKLEQICFEKLSQFSSPEYFEIRQSVDLTNEGELSDKWRAFTATKFGDIRLIDNIALN